MIRKQKDGMYLLDMRIEGKRIRRKFKRREDAVAFHAGEILELENYNVTVTQAIDKVLAVRWAGLASEDAALTRAQWLVKAHGKDALIRHAASPEGVSTLLSSMRAARLRPGYHNAILSTATIIFSECFEMRWIEDVPKLARFRVQDCDGRTRYLSQTEEQVLLQLLGTKYPQYFYAIVVFLLDTGLRKGEALNLRWSDFDEIAGTIRVSRTKTGKERTVPLTARAIRTLESRRNEKGTSKGPWSGHRDQQLAYQWRKAMIELRWQDDDLTIHSLRHTFATRLAAAGEAGYTIGKLLGHSSPTTTLRYVHHLEDSRLKDAIRVLDTPSANDTHTLDDDG